MSLFRTEKKFVSIEILGAGRKGGIGGDRIKWLKEISAEGLTLKCDSNKDCVCIIKDIKGQVCVIETHNIKTTPRSLRLGAFWNASDFMQSVQPVLFLISLG